MEFGNLREELTKMSGNERKKVITDLRNECICHACPTYNTCTRQSEELLYCMVGSSDCPIHERKCICPQNCPVYEKYGFNSSFYCSKNKDVKKNLIYKKNVVRV